MKNFMSMNKLNNSGYKNYDYLGVLLSILCGAHCLVTPLLIIYLPIVGETVETTWFHTGMIAFMGFAFYQSIYKHFKFHQSKFVLSLGLAGIVLFLTSYISELIHHSGEHEHGHNLSDIHGDETAMIYVAISGSILLVSAHILNIRKCKCLKGQGLCMGKE